MNWVFKLAFGTLVAPVAMVDIALAQTASPWFDGYNSKTRLIAGSVAAKGGPQRMFAGIEVVMPDGWKTYWRNPGDAGGVPPYFDWAGSDNLASAKVLYPAPSRLKDASGDSVGYKKTVLFPVEVTAKDPAQPITLALSMEFGVCREICVPAEAKLSLALPVNAAIPPSTSLTAAYETVPRKGSDRRAADPAFKVGRATLTGDKPKLEFDIAFAKSSTGADLFVEAPDGIYLSLPKKVGGGSAGVTTFEIDLATGVEPAELKGRTLTLTMVGVGGHAEATWKID